MVFRHTSFHFKLFNPKQGITKSRLGPDPNLLLF